MVLLYYVFLMLIYIAQPEVFSGPFFRVSLIPDDYLKPPVPYHLSPDHPDHQHYDDVGSGVHNSNLKW